MFVNLEMVAQLVHSLDIQEMTSTWRLEY